MVRQKRGRKRSAKLPLVVECIFREPTKSHKPLSQEHVWGEWLKDYVRSGFNKHHLHHEEVGRPGTQNRETLTLRAGDPLYSKAKVVCRGCNNGWLSGIQERAKPYLVPLIQGHSAVMGTPAMDAIAAWCVMATMTGEYLTRDTTAVAVSQGERDWFRDHGTPPPNWKVWLGHYQRYRWQGRWAHFVLPILDAKHIVRTEEDRRAPPNTQTTTFIIGNLLVHTMSTSADPDIVARWDWGGPTTRLSKQRLVQIVPPKESIVVWPPPSLTDFEAQFVANAFDSVIDAASRSAFGNRLF